MRISSQVCQPSYLCNKVTLLGTQNREPQEYSWNIIGIYLPGSLYSVIFLYVLGVPCLGFPIKSL